VLKHEKDFKEHKSRLDRISKVSKLNVGGSMNLHMHLVKGSVNTSQYDGQSVSMSQNVTALPPIN